MKPARRIQNSAYVKTGKNYRLKHKLLNKNFVRRRILYYLIIFFSSALVVNLSATVTSSSGMGIGDNLSWMLNDQLPYMFVNPVYVKGYKNKIYFENVNNANQGGIFIPLPFNMTLGVLSGTTVNNEAFNETTFESLFHKGTNTQQVDINGNVQPVINSNFGANTILIDDIDDATKNPLKFKNLDVLFGIDLGRLELGTSISYAYANTTQEKRTTLPANSTASQVFRQSKAQYQFIIGSVYDLNLWKFKQIDGSIFFTKYILNNKYEGIRNGTQRIDAGFETSGAFDTGLNIRITMPLSKRNTVRVYSSYAYLNRSTRAFASSSITNSIFNAEDTFSRKGQKLSVGASHEIRLTKYILAFWGSQFDYKTFQNNYDGSGSANNVSQFAANPYNESAFSMTMPLVLGVSSRLTKSFDVSFGVRHNIINSSNNNEITDQTRNDVTQSTIDRAQVTTNTAFLTSASNINIGISYRIGRFKLDWLGNVQMLKDGPYFLSGKENALATAFAVSFDFSESFKEEVAIENEKN